MPEIRLACCLRCRNLMVVNPTMAVGPVLVLEGTVCPHCIFYEELPERYGRYPPRGTSVAVTHRGAR
jgi:hypothetical protein